MSPAASPKKPATTSFTIGTRAVAAVFGEIRGDDLVSPVASAKYFLILGGIAAVSMQIDARSLRRGARVVEPAVIGQRGDAEIVGGGQNVFEVLKSVDVLDVDGDFVAATLAEAVEDVLAVVRNAFQGHAGGMIGGQRLRIHEHMVLAGEALAVVEDAEIGGAVLIDEEQAAISFHGYAGRIDFH